MLVGIITLIMGIVCSLVPIFYGLNHIDDTPMKVFVNTFPWSVFGPLFIIIGTFIIMQSEENDL